MRVCNRRTCPIGIKSIAVDRPSTTRTHPPWHAFEPRATLSWRKMGCHSSQKCWEDNRILGNSASHSSSKHQPTINLPSTYHPHLTTGPPGLHRGSSGPVAPHRPLSRLAAPGSSGPELPRPHLSRHLSIGNLNLPNIPKLWMAIVDGRMAYSMEWDTVMRSAQLLECR